MKFDFTQTLDEIQGSASGTINPYGFHRTTRTQGFMKGGILMSPKVALGGAVDQKTGNICLWYEAVDLRIEIDPEVVIAKEVHADPCTRKAVLDHEMKHVFADRQIVNKYAKLMGKRIYEALQQRGFVVGPIPASSQKDVAIRMQETVFQVVSKERRRMRIDREDLQSSIDSLEEYNRVSALCQEPAAAPQTKTKKRRR